LWKVEIRHPLRYEPRGDGNERASIPYSCMVGVILPKVLVRGETVRRCRGAGGMWLSIRTKRSCCCYVLLLLRLAGCLPDARVTQSGGIEEVGSAANDRLRQYLLEYIHLLPSKICSGRLSSRGANVARQKITGGQEKSWPFCGTGELRGKSNSFLNH